MERWARISTLTACVALAFGCDDQTEVQRQTRDLQEAQKNVPQVTKELEVQLEEAKASVAQLEQKLALARQGLTDDVLENQKELQAALKEQEQSVQSELGEAKREAQVHARDTEAALQTLGQTARPVRDPAAVPPGEPTPPAPVTTPETEAPIEDRVPVRGTDDELEAPAEPAAPATPPAPPQTSSPVADPTGAVPPLPPRPTLPASDGEARALEPSAPAPAPEQP